MRSPAVSLLVLALTLTVGSRASAEDAPPRIGPFVIDVRATVPKFKQQDPQLAESRGLDVGELPGAGIGVDAAAHVYLLTWKAVTVGVGAQLTLARSHTPPPATVEMTLVVCADAGRGQTCAMTRRANTTPSAA